MSFERRILGEETCCVAEMIFGLATNFGLSGNFDEVGIIGSTVLESIEGGSREGHCGLIQDTNQGIVSWCTLKSLIGHVPSKPSCFINSLINLLLVFSICKNIEISGSNVRQKRQ
jgi:hypothetical protein